MESAAQPATPADAEVSPPGTRRRATAAAVTGTVFEWFDFFLYGSLVAVFGRQFFPPGDETTGLLAALAAFGAGWVVRPLGALVFGRMGDRVGRKRTFLVTIVLMGGATVGIGLLPTYAQVGLLAPALLVLLRLVQGFAVGGEFGGAATYVAEHAPPERRALYTSLIQGTGTVGLLLALLVIAATRSALGAADFETWGWRVPFLSSILLLALSVWMRLRLGESPLFERARAADALSRSPLRDAFGSWTHVRSMLVALATLTMAQGVVWSTGQYFPLVYLQSQLGVDVGTTSWLMACVLLLTAPLFPLAGALADRIGRRPVVIAGFLMAAALSMPVYAGLRDSAAGGELAFAAALGWLMAMAVPVALTCAPASAYLVELFPTRIRYSAMGLPYHLGNGWFGGFMPLATAGLGAHFGDPLAGLYYPIGLSLFCAVMAVLLMPETRGRAL
jgi:MFS family permease